MDPINILRRVAAEHDDDDGDVSHASLNPQTATAGLLWHLQSRVLSGSQKAFYGRFEKAYSETIQQQGWLKRGSSRFSGSVEDAVRTFCEHGEARRSLIAALSEFIAREDQAAKERFCLTNIGHQVWDSLDWCLEERRPCFIQGLEGRGKSASARAWFEAHRGQARYVSLDGLGLQRDFYSVLARGYGIPVSGAKAAGEIRWRVTDVIVRSGLVLIIDEAHFCLPERVKDGGPPLLNWIDTALCNAGVAVCLVSTPQFGPRLAEFQKRTGWNARQFIRRFAGRWTDLPVATSVADLTALAERALPKVGRKGINLAAGYAGAVGYGNASADNRIARDVSGLFDLIRDAERRARKAGRGAVTYQDLHDAYEIDRLPTENAIAAAFKSQTYDQPGESPATSLPDAGSGPDADTLQRRGATPALPDFTPPLRGTRVADLVSDI